MGDTALFDDMKLIHGYYRPDLIIIPIGGYYSIEPKQVAYATRVYLRPWYAIPNTTAHLPCLKGTPAEYRQALGRPLTQLLALKPGQTVAPGPASSADYTAVKAAGRNDERTPGSVTEAVEVVPVETAEVIPGMTPEAPRVIPSNR